MQLGLVHPVASAGTFSGRHQQGNELGSSGMAGVDMRGSFSGLCAIIVETLGANPVADANSCLEILANRADRLHVISANRTELRTDASIIRSPGPELIGRCGGSLPGFALGRQG